MCDWECNQGRDCECFVETDEYSRKTEDTLYLIADCLMIVLTVSFLLFIVN